MKKICLVILLILLFVVGGVLADTPTLLTLQLKTHGGNVSNYANDSNVLVYITSSGTDVNAMRFSCDNSTWTDWTTYSSTSYFDLNSGNYGCTASSGSRTVYGEVRDANLDVSTSTSDSIILDFNSPIVVSFSPSSNVGNGDGASGQQISISLTDDFNLSSISISLDRGSTDIYDSNSDACTISGTSTTCSFTDFSVDRTGTYNYSFVVRRLSSST